MQGVKKSGKSEKSLLMELSERVGYKEPDEPELAKYDPSTGTYFCSTLDKAPKELMIEARDHFQAEAVMLRAQAEATLAPNSSAMFTKKATYARLAAQALEKEIKSDS